MDIDKQKQIAASNLKSAKQALDSLNVPSFLFLGTALGAYRDGDFCPGDIDDIDLGVSVEYIGRFKEIEGAMHRQGFSGGLKFLNPEGIAPEAAFEKFYQEDMEMPEYMHGNDWWKSKVDIFFVTPVGDNMAWVFYTHIQKNEYQVRLIDKKFFKDFDKVKFYGEEYYVPHPIEEYLAANYGPEWRTPIHRDNWQWDKDNKIPIR